jgi:hypothetical protein
MFRDCLHKLPKSKIGEYRNIKYIYLVHDIFPPWNEQEIKFTGKNFLSLAVWQQQLEYCRRENRITARDLTEKIGRPFPRDKSRIFRRVHNIVPFIYNQKCFDSNKDVNYKLFYYPDNSQWNEPFNYIEFETIERFEAMDHQSAKYKYYSERPHLLRVLMRRTNIKLSRARAAEVKEAERKKQFALDFQVMQDSFASMTALFAANEVRAANLNAEALFRIGSTYFDSNITINNITINNTIINETTINSIDTSNTIDTANTIDSIVTLNTKNTPIKKRSVFEEIEAQIAFMELEHQQYMSEINTLRDRVYTSHLIFATNSSNF